MTFLALNSIHIIIVYSKHRKYNIKYTQYYVKKCAQQQYIVEKKNNKFDEI